MRITKHLTLRHALIALALVFAQQAAQLHLLSHLARDIALIENGGMGVPPIGHPAELCIAFHAVDSALPSMALLAEPPRIAPQADASFPASILFPPRIVFDSRAPPALS